MFYRTCFFVIVLAALLGMSGCKGKSPQTSSADNKDTKVLAKVNGTPITAADIAFRPPEPHGLPTWYPEKTLDDIINQELLYQQGLKLGLDKDPSYRNNLAKLNAMPPGAKRLEMARRVFNTQIASTIEVTYQDGKDYFDKNADRIATELQLEMAKFDKRQDAEDALKKLRGGASVESVARPVMGNKPVDGRMPWDLGFVKWDKVPVDFQEQIYKLKPGEVSDVLGSQGTGFQIVKLLAVRKRPKYDYPAVSAVVMNQLRDLKLLEAYNQYVAQLRKAANIVTF